MHARYPPNMPHNILQNNFPCWSANGEKYWWRPIVAWW
jgi:hypothetical protein